MKPSGYLLHETPELAVVITLDSANVKTGNMAQVWIIRADMHPVEAVSTGADQLICGDCPHRGTTCYVQIGRAPASIYLAYKRGRYPRLTDYAILSGLTIRLGAYGDPAFIPRRVLRKLANVATGRTGYTHQWRTNPWLKPFVMASVDSVIELNEARAAGWRTFRVSPDTIAQSGEILCPASEEAGKRTTCKACRLCDGAKPGDVRKSIFIPVHGARKSSFIQIAA